MFARLLAPFAAANPLKVWVLCWSDLLVVLVKVNKR